jgi:hypothetical protein
MEKIMFYLFLSALRFYLPDIPPLQGRIGGVVRAAKYELCRTKIWPFL